MNKKKLTPKYYDNKAIRIKIDKLLEQNARNVANNGTGSKFDLGSDQAVEAEWDSLLVKIKGIDSAFYDIVKRHKR